MQKLNTHYYDGKLTNRIADLSKEIHGKTLLPLDQCFSEILALIAKLLKNPKKQRLAVRMLNKLKNSQDHANYDAKNKIHVHDLLPMVWYKVKNYDISGKMLFLEQIIDISGGSCAQGRVTRLLQLV